MSSSHLHKPHIVPVPIYVGVFLALLVGTGGTVWAAYQDFGMWNTPVAMVIAIVKALLVILFFMHVKYSSRLVWLFLAAAFLWLALLIGGTVPDFLSRGLLGSRAGPNKPAKAFTLEDR